METLKEKDQYLRKVTLPEEAVKDAFKFLGYAGINNFTMFPDLDGLSNYLKQKYLSTQG